MNSESSKNSSPSRVLIQRLWNSSPISCVCVIALLLAGAFFELLGLSSLVPAVLSVLDGRVKIPAPLEALLAYTNLPVASWPIERYLLVVVAATILRASAIFGAQLFLASLGAKVEAESSSSLLDACLKARWSFLKDQSVDAVLDAVTRQSQETGYAVSYLAHAAVACVIALCFFIGVVILSPFIFACAMAVAVPIGLLMYQIVRSTHDAALNLIPLQQLKNKITLEALTNAKFIKASNSEEDALARFRHAHEQSGRAHLQVGVGNALASAVPESMVVIGISVLLLALSRSVSSPDGNSLLAILMLYRGLHYVNSLSIHRQYVSRFAPSYQGILKMRDEALAQQEMTMPIVVDKPFHFRQKIEFRNVSFAYEAGLYILRDFSLRIDKSTCNILTGPSGVGKSTVIDLLMGLITPQSGEIQVDGITLSGDILPAWRRAVAYLPQEGIVFDGTIRENLGDLNQTIPECELFEALGKVKLADLVRSRPEGLNAPVGLRGLMLSGGQRQRLALARALLTKKQILIIDEGTNALDMKNEQELLMKLTESQNDLTIIIIAHRVALEQNHPRRAVTTAAASQIELTIVSDARPS